VIALRVQLDFPKPGKGGWNDGGRTNRRCRAGGGGDLTIAAPGWSLQHRGHFPMNTLIVRSLVVAVLLLFSWLAWQEQNKPEKPVEVGASQTTEVTGETAAEVEPPGGYRDPMQFFIYMVFVAIALGVIVLKWLIPALGDRVGEAFYSAPEKAEQTATQKAMSLVAQGEYRKALAAFEKILEENPTDRFAVMEMAKLHQDKLGDTEAAINGLESAVAGEWPEDDKCFFLLKLADIHASQRNDFDRARELLHQLIETYPESHQAANAHHKLREIEEQEFLAKRQEH
jgi:TolA-binding protein